MASEPVAKERGRESGRGLVPGAAVMAVAVLALLAYRPALRVLESTENERIIAGLDPSAPGSLRAGFERVRALEPPRRRLGVLRDPRTTGVVTTLIARGDRDSIRLGFELIAPFDLEWQQQVKNDEEVRAAVLAHYRERVALAFDPGSSRYDARAALAALDELDEIYPASGGAPGLRDAFENERAALAAELENEYERRIASGSIDSGDPAGVDGVLAVLRQAAPEHGLLRDPRLPMLRKKLALRRADERASALERALARRREWPIGLDDVDTMRAALLELRALRPGSSLIRDVGWEIARLMEAEMAAASTPAERMSAERRLVANAPLLEIDWLTRTRARVRSAWPEGGAEQREWRRVETARHASAVNGLLARPTLTPRWRARLDAHLKGFLALAGPDAPGVSTAFAALERLYRDGAREALEEGEPETAATLIEAGRIYTPGSVLLEEVAREARAMAPDVDTRR